MRGSNNQMRYRNGVFHPLMSAPTIPNSIKRLKGWKKSPGFNGNRGPYGRRLNEAGGFALHAPATMRRSNNLPPKPIPQPITENQRNAWVSRSGDMVWPPPSRVLGRSIPIYVRQATGFDDDAGGRPVLT